MQSARKKRVIILGELGEMKFSSLKSLENSWNVIHRNLQPPQDCQEGLFV